MWPNFLIKIAIHPTVPHSASAMDYVTCRAMSLSERRLTLSARQLFFLGAQDRQLAGAWLRAGDVGQTPHAFCGNQLWSFRHSESWSAQGASRRAGGELWLRKDEQWATSKSKRRTRDISAFASPRHPAVPWFRKRKRATKMHEKENLVSWGLSSGRVCNSTALRRRIDSLVTTATTTHGPNNKRQPA